MTGWLKRGALMLAAGALALAAVLAYRALTIDAAQAPRAELATPVLDEAGAVDRLARAIRFRTVSHTDRARIDPAPFEAFNAWLVTAYPRVHDTLVRETVGGHSLLYTWRGTQPALAPVLLLGHTDVVPVDEATRAEWARPPFAGVVADGAVWGRGALDDKASVIALLEAVEALIGAGHRPARTIHLAFGDDEEIGGARGAARIAELLASRGVRPAMVLDEGSGILEGLLPVDFPVAAIAVAEKGYLSLELAARGRGGHSSMPPPLTAAGRVARAVERVQSTSFPTRLAPPVRDLLETLAPHMDPAPRVLMSNLWLFEPLVTRLFAGSPGTAAAVRTTAAPTMLSGGPKDNVLPERAGAVINFRLLPGDTVASVRDRVKRLVDDQQVSIGVYGGSVSEPSPVADASAPGFRAIASVARALDPRIVAAPSLVVGTTDARHYIGIADDVYRFLPLRLDGEAVGAIHGTGEHIPVADFLDMIRAYAALLQQPWVSGEAP